MERVTTSDGSPEIRELICPLYNSPDLSGTVFNSKVEDIKEISRNLYDSESSKICRLFYASKTPDQDIRSTSKEKRSTAKYLEPVPGPGYALPFHRRPLTSGYMVDDIQFINKMTDMAAQMIPTYACTQRR